MNKYCIALVIIIICLLGLFTGHVAVFADSSGYDEAEQIRRAADRLDKIDEYQKEQARQRYDAGNGSSSSDSIGDVILGLSLLLLFGYGILKIFQFKQTTDEKNLIQENIRNNDLSKATALGFKIDDSSKICPACAETIKLKAEICKHCKKSFSKDEIQKDIDSVINSFFHKQGMKL